MRPPGPIADPRGWRASRVPSGRPARAAPLCAARFAVPQVRAGGALRLCTSLAATLHELLEPAGQGDVEAGGVAVAAAAVAGRDRRDVELADRVERDVDAVRGHPVDGAPGHAE